VAEGDHAHEPDRWAELGAAALDVSQHHAFQNVQQNSVKITNILF